ncbi:MAG: DNA polymerase III subunit alpha [Ignavibacteria bacterium]|nr:DNA polymerase III subunit alpha [Ignavibacteria bacterium]
MHYIFKTYSTDFMQEFVHLHNHSHYSLLDAISRIEDLVDAAVNEKMRAVALTDHGVLYGALEFYKACKSREIKPVIGCEVYVAQSGSRFDRGKRNEYSPENGDSADGLTSSINYAHLILLAKDLVGYKNLIKLVSIGHTEGFYYKPRIDIEMLSKYSKGLVATSACAGGVISCYIVRDDLDTAKKMTGVYKDIFGDDFYLEIQDHKTIDAEKKVLAQMPKLAKKFGLKLIATNDVHYIKKEHSVAHNIYLHLSAKQSKLTNNFNVTTDLRYGTDEIYFKSAAQMCELFKDYPEAIKSTIEVTEKCNLELDMKTNYMPNFKLPADVETSISFDDYLAIVSKEGMRKRIAVVNDETEKRLEYELDVIKRMNFAGYFLIVRDFIIEAKRRGIIVGPGRGSATGSLVCYCIGITDVNPLEYDLLFERFLNPERISMPDIDIDFQDDRRDEMFQYAKQQYGETAVAQIITFNRLAARGVLKDVGRVLNINFSEINELTKIIPVQFGKVTPLERCFDEIDDFKKYFKDAPQSQKAQREQLFDNCLVLENLNKNSSIHASGIVIAPSDITDYVPLSKVAGEDNVFCTQFDMNQLEDAGLIKMDFLGLKELKVIKKTFDLVNSRHNLDLSIEKIPLDDSRTFDLFSAGSTVGVFQFSNSKMREYLAKMKPRNINDLAIMNALYRPGPMKFIPEFLEKRTRGEKVNYLHPLMENALKETYGIIIFQEQAMQIARDVAGFSMAQADNMRKAMGKKIKQIMLSIHNEFINGALNKGVKKDIAEKIFNQILDFADYGFNKSHAVAYSILAFYTAYLKTHYPLEFLAVSMECRKDSETELQQLANECGKMGVRLMKPDVNSGNVDFKVRYFDERSTDKGEIIYGLSAIKNVGEKAVAAIVSERENNGEFISFIDFCKRVDLKQVNKKTLEGLIFSGAFDNLEPNRRKLYCNIERVIAFAQKYKLKPESRGQEGLFEISDLNEREDEYILDECEEFPENEKFSREKSALGFYLSGHPLEKFRSRIERFTTLTFGTDVNEVDFTKTGKVRMCGVISDLEERISKRGKKFAVFNLIDFEGSGECIAFGQAYELNSALFVNDNPIFLSGKAEENGDKIKLTVDQAIHIDSFETQLAENVTIKLDNTESSEKLLDEIYNTATNYMGSCGLYFQVRENGSSKIYLSQSLRIHPDGILELKNIVGENNLYIN